MSPEGGAGEERECEKYLCTEFLSSRIGLHLHSLGHVHPCVLSGRTPTRLKGSSLGTAMYRPHSYAYFPTYWGSHKVLGPQGIRRLEG